MNHDNCRDHDNYSTLLHCASGKNTENSTVPKNAILTLLGVQKTLGMAHQLLVCKSTAGDDLVSTHPVRADLVIRGEVEVARAVVRDEEEVRLVRVLRAARRRREEAVVPPRW